MHMVHCAWNARLKGVLPRLPIGLLLLRGIGAEDTRATGGMAAMAVTRTTRAMWKSGENLRTFPLRTMVALPLCEGADPEVRFH